MARLSSTTATTEDKGETSLAEQIASIRFLIPFVWRADYPGFRLRIVAAFLVILVGQVITVAAPFALAEGINRLSVDSPEMGAAATVFGLILGYGVIRFVAAATPNFREYLFSRVGQTAQREVGLAVFSHLHDLSLRFHLERRTGGLARLVDRGVRSIDFFFRFLVFNIGPTIIQLVLVSVAFGIRYNLVMVAIVIATVVAYFWYTITTTERRIAIRRALNEADQQANTRAIDALLNYETVKYFGNERFEHERYNHSLRDYQEASIKWSRSLASLNIGQSLIINLGLIGALWLTVAGVLNGIYGIGEITGVSLIIIQLYQPLNILGFAYREIKQSLVDMEKMFRLLRKSPEVTDTPDAPDVKVTAGEVAFDNVSFGYDRDREILKGLSFVAAPGQNVAFVGASGAGKSTIARLVYRFYDVWSGKITIDGQPIDEVSQRSLRRAIGMVPQDTVLFNDTIGYNIAYGRPGASQENIARVAELAQIDGFIDSLPKGYDTLVGERGLKLSGGEKQRIAIARTLLKDPPILILDEATSALDSQTEKGILDALRVASKDRTTLVIAHRLSTIIDADVINVVDEGQIIESGHHEDLLAEGGRYAELWNRQSQQMAAAAE